MTSRNCWSLRRTPCLENRRSEEHTSELQSHLNLVCRLLLEKKKIRDQHMQERGLVEPDRLLVGHSGGAPDEIGACGRGPHQRVAPSFLRPCQLRHVTHASPN